jgi:hypothetical protein
MPLALHWRWMKRDQARSASTARARASLAVAVPTIAVLVAAVAMAQPRKPGEAAGGARPAARAGATGKAPSTDVRDAAAGASRFQGTPAPAPQGAIVASDAGVVEARTLDGGTHVFKFSELDIEGRLKSPQLVYFLRRVRAEFAAEELGHRTFLREMSETRKESSF